MPDEPIDFVEKVAKLSVEPGDALVLRTARPISDEMAASLRERMHKAFPGVRVLVLEPDCELSVLHFEQSRDDKLSITVTMTEAAREKPIGSSSSGMLRRN